MQTVTPKRGRALIWPSTLDENPDHKDPRTNHQALPVAKGIKYGTHALYPYNFLSSALCSLSFISLCAICLLQVRMRGSTREITRHRTSRTANSDWFAQYIYLDYSGSATRRRL